MDYMQDMFLLFGFFLARKYKIEYITQLAVISSEFLLLTKLGLIYKQKKKKRKLTK